MRYDSLELLNSLTEDLVQKNINQIASRIIDNRWDYDVWRCPGHHIQIMEERIDQLNIIKNVMVLMCINEKEFLYNYNDSGINEHIVYGLMDAYEIIPVDEMKKVCSDIKNWYQN